jgi:hypothetical protein
VANVVAVGFALLGKAVFCQVDICYTHATMKNNFRLIRVYSLVLAFLLASCASGGDDFRPRLEKLNDKIETVSRVIDQADGYPGKAGRIDLQVAKFFAQYIAWELEHPEIMKDALVSSKRFEKNIHFDKTTRDKRYTHHVDHELRASMDILDQALARLEQKNSWPAVPEIPWRQMTFDKGYFRVKGRPVFPGGFNMTRYNMLDLSQYPQWADRDKALRRKFLKKMRSIDVGIVGHGVSVPSLIKDDGSVCQAGIQKTADSIRDSGGMGFKVGLLIHWGGDKGVLEKHWPGITEYRANGVYLDIDHPGIRVMIARVMSRLMPVLKNRPEILAIDLANEPYFDIEQWSPHTLKKYHGWLRRRHGGIGKLNALWKTRFTRFEDIPLPGGSRQKDCSAGQWYDRVTFHSFRVASFFGFVSNEIRKYIPQIAIHIKGQDNSSLGPLPSAVSDGIDREMLTAVSRLQGVDTRPLPVADPRMAAGNYDNSIYGFHWLGQSFLYDYLTSLPPRQPVVDFEYHAFSINPIRIPDMKPTHPRASLWMAHLHGLIGNVTWYWHRRFGPNPFPDKYFATWLYGSISTQPRIASGYFQTMLRLNIFAKEVEALASVPDRPVRLFVSKSSYIRNQAHIDALHRAYEGSCFHGLRVGFVTEKMLAAGGVPKDCRVIIIPDAGYVSQSALRALSQAKSKGVQLIRYGTVKPTCNEYGIPHASSATAFLNNVPAIDNTTAPELSRKIGKLLSSAGASLPLRVSVVNGRGAFGVMQRQAKVDGKTVVLLINVSDKPLKVQLRAKEGRAVSGYDMLNNESIEGSEIVLPFQGVRLISIKAGR